MKKLVLFGAGKIGRSFIGQLFSRSGYEVVFIDIFQAVIDELNRRKSYNVIIKGNNEDIIKVDFVRGVLGTDKKAVAYEVATADILAVSVGQQGLTHIIPVIAEGFKQRYSSNSTNALDIIIAENLRNASEFIKSELLKYLPTDYPIEKLVGLVETSIGKMVPIMLKKDMEDDILQVFAEAYNTLILDKKGFKNPVPEVNGLAPKENMKAWVDRKSFIHNLGHAVTAYMCYMYDPTFLFIYEPLAIPEIKKFVRDTMLQSAKILMAEYPNEFTLKSLTEHIDDLIQRFENKALGDTVYRVGCDLLRKLSREDRLMGAILMGAKHKLPYDNILYALVCGFYFRATDEQGVMLPRDREFNSDYFERGPEFVLINCCGLITESERDIVDKALNVNQSLRNGKFIIQS